MTEPLSPGQLARHADLARLDFASTATVQAGDTMIGQRRAPRALRLPAGRAPQLRKAIDDLIADLEVALPAAIDAGETGLVRRAA